MHILVAEGERIKSSDFCPRGLKRTGKWNTKLVSFFAINCRIKMLTERSGLEKIFIQNSLIDGYALGGCFKIFGLRNACFS